MEEQVGMMAHNEKYKQSVEDDLYQESHIAKVGSNEMEMIKSTDQDQEEPVAAAD